MYRKVIQISAEDSPNVRRARYLKQKHPKATDEEITDMVRRWPGWIPGVVEWADYQLKRRIWDKIMQCVCLDGMFYKGAGQMLYPPDWLAASAEWANEIAKLRRTSTRAMGVDCGAGRDKSCWTVADRLGVLHQEAFPTANTSDIPGRTIALMKQWDVKPQNVCFDYGGGGKQWVDYLRNDRKVPGRPCIPVRSIMFGEAATSPDQFWPMLPSQRQRNAENRVVYRNRRAEMYGMLRELMDIELQEHPFAIPSTYVELRRQLAPLPYLLDDEGRMWLPPKDRKRPNSKEEVTIRSILGCSPDEADSLVLAIFGLVSSEKAIKVGIYGSG